MRAIKDWQPDHGWMSPRKRCGHPQETVALWGSREGQESRRRSKVQIVIHRRTHSTAAQLLLLLFGGNCSWIPPEISWFILFWQVLFCKGCSGEIDWDIFALCSISLLLLTNQIAKGRKFISRLADIPPTSDRISSRVFRFTLRVWTFLHMCELCPHYVTSVLPVWAHRSVCVFHLRKIYFHFTVFAHVSWPS